MWEEKRTMEKIRTLWDLFYYGHIIILFPIPYSSSFFFKTLTERDLSIQSLSQIQEFFQLLISGIAIEQFIRQNHKFGEKLKRTNVLIQVVIFVSLSLLIFSIQLTSYGCGK